MRSKLNIIVLGYIVRGPIGGMTWHHLQYCLGLKQLGHNVFFMEDSGDSEYCCYDPIRNVTDANATYGLKYATEVFQMSGMEKDWAYFDMHTNTWYGNAERVENVISNADMFINVSLINPVRDSLQRIPVRVLIDTDPVFTQIRNTNEPARMKIAREHNFFFTFGENYGEAGCTIPADGFPWKPTRQPVFLPAWKSLQNKPSGNWTTVMQWDSYKSEKFEGREFGMKSVSFEEYLDIPHQFPGEKFSLAIGGAPFERLKSHGWEILDFFPPSQSPWTYKKFIENSKGEFSVAKHGYRSSLSGWFSERSANYLAMGKPVITQDTGFSKLLPTGKGLFAFNSPNDIKHLLDEVNSDYDLHSKHARLIAEEFFNSDTVLRKLLNSL